MLARVVVRNILLTALLLSGCVGHYASPIEMPGTSFPYAVDIDLSSQIDDPYYVMSGPSETYRRFSFNGWCRSALQQFRVENFKTGDQPVLSINIVLIKLKTSYDEFGMMPYQGGLALFSGLDDDDGGLDVPVEIYKGAALTAEIQLVANGEVILSKRLQPSFNTTVHGEDFDSWSYDYGPVLRGVIQQLLEDISLALPRSI